MGYAGEIADAPSKQWLKERFSKVLDILQESWVYQETLQKGIEQGIEQGLEQIRERARAEGREEGAIHAMRQIAIKIVVACFPDLEQLARTIIPTISNPKQLERLVMVLSILTSREDVEQLLHSFVSTAQT